jgi:uncharacterized protein with HEPN domain
VPPTLGDRVVHILEAIEEIEWAVAGKTFATFAGDRFLRLGIERLLEIVCEASQHIPEQMKTKQTDIAWHKMIGNRLRHAYHNVDATIVWNVISDDLPPLKSFVRQIIEDEARRNGNR